MFSAYHFWDEGSFFRGDSLWKMGFWNEILRERNKTDQQKWLQISFLWITSLGSLFSTFRHICFIIIFEIFHHFLRYFFTCSHQLYTIEISFFYFLGHWRCSHFFPREIQIIFKFKFRRERLSFLFSGESIVFRVFFLLFLTFMFSLISFPDELQSGKSWWAVKPIFFHLVHFNPEMMYCTRNNHLNLAHFVNQNCFCNTFMFPDFDILAVGN